MFISFYTVNPDRLDFPKSYIVRIFKDDTLIRTVCFPICNPNLLLKLKIRLPNMAVWLFVKLWIRNLPND